MKRRVRIYKAQLGGVQAIQEEQVQAPAQSQQQDEMIQASIVGMLDRGDLPEDVLDQLMQAGIEQEKATYLINGAIAYIEDQRALKEAEYQGDEETYDTLQEEQDMLTSDAEEDRQDALLAQMYESDNYDEGYDEEDQFVQDYIIDSPQQEEIAYEKTGGVPNKRTFVKRASKAIKAQMGQEMSPPAKADSTDTGVRQMMMASFLRSVQDTGNNALIKKDAEQAYDMASQYPMSDPNTPMAQFGLNMRPGQQRRFNRRLNRAIGNIPIPTQGMMPAGFVTYPMLQGLQQYMPAQGSYYGGPQLANIDVRKTGLFGRPKEYTITFAQQALYDPTLRRDVIKQEARNSGVLTEDEIDELIKKEEIITGNKSETPKAEEKREASGKKDISSSGASSASNSSSNRVSSTPAGSGSSNVPQPVVPASAPGITSTDYDKVLAKNAANSAFLGNYRDINQNYFGQTPAPAKSTQVKSAYSNKNTPTDMFYYNPDKPGYSYVYQDGKLYYDDATDKDQKFIEVKDQARILELNKKLRGADIYTLPGKPNAYYRQRPDGSYEKFEGDPAKHSQSAKQVAIIKPGDKTFDYLNKNKQYSYSFSGKKKQFGGFTDEASGLNKFVYGGDDTFALPESAGKLTDSPYFEYGGSFDNGGESDTTLVDILDANGNVIGMTTLALAEKKGLSHRVRTEKLENRNNYSGYNSYSPFVFPGGYAKQRGLPYDPETGEKYYGNFSPYGQVSKINVTKTRLSGAPKKYTMYYTDYFPTESGTSKPVTNVSTEKKTNNNFDVSDNYGRTFGDRVRGLGYKLMPKNKDIIREPRFRNELNQARADKLGVPFLEPKAYGGDMDYAQTGLNYPYALDPRFYPSLPSEEEQQAFIDAAGSLDTPIVDNTPIDFSDVLGMKEYVRGQVNKEGIDPTAFGTAEEVNPILADPKTYAIDMRSKRTNEELKRGLDMFNAGAYGITGMLGERGQRDIMRQMYDRLKSDALYGSTGVYDRGTYEANSGLFRPDQMGFTGVVKYGGDVNYKEGGEAYMSEDQIRKFLEEGGELEFV